jgi:hypothetical protein
MNTDHTYLAKSCTFIDTSLCTFQCLGTEIDTTTLWILCLKNTMSFGRTKIILEFRILFKMEIESRVVMATDVQIRPSVTSDKALVRQIRVNAMLTFDRIKLELLCPWWLPRCCHVEWLDISTSRKACLETMFFVMF